MSSSRGGKRRSIVRAETMLDKAVLEETCMSSCHRCRQIHERSDRFYFSAWVLRFMDHVVISLMQQEEFVDAKEVDESCESSENRERASKAIKQEDPRHEEIPRKSLFIFHRDLRVTDNLALQTLIRREKSFHNTIMCVIKDRQLEKNTHATGFFRECIKWLEDELGDDHKVREVDDIAEFLKTTRPEIIYYNENELMMSTWKQVREYGALKGVEIVTEEHDYVMLPPSVLTSPSTGHVYQVFTPFYNTHVQNLPRSFEIAKSHTKRFPDAMTLLTKIRLGSFNDYAEKRDHIKEDRTTHMGPYLNFGVFSIREACDAIREAQGKKSELLRQLIWRDFYYYSYHRVKTWLEKKESDYKPKIKEWKKFVAGDTGHPLIDIGVKTLNETGWLHNRLRMNVAIYARKKEFQPSVVEEWFACNLTDFFDSSNAGGVHWAYIQPPFKLLSADVQQKKYYGAIPNQAGS
eukprot:GHVU01069788.1.p1 GENE.GHVU01069788.1~~GHVU01069788.1.p1  ORF type:complete len:463 (-),score=61.22 GHVU01069788.1:1238-2626(-)